MSSENLSDADIVNFLDAGNHETDNRPGDPLTKARVRVTLDQLRPYDRNPRQSRNPKFDSILASIETRGLDHSPNISRRHPDDPHYMIIDGGNTRLEILNILYDKYKALAEAAEAAENDEERRGLMEKAQSFFVIDCVFKPWQSESSTLAGHMSENEERGDTLFIEKALAVQEFRRVYEEEDRAAVHADETFHGKPLTIRAMADRITAQGWTISNSHISRFEYATERLLSVVPTALWAGGGEPLVKSIRRLEKAYKTFWASIDAGRDNPLRIQDLFFDTLQAFDDDPIDIEGFTRALDTALAEETGLPAMTVSAEVGAMMAGGMSTSLPPAAPPSSTDESRVKEPQSAHQKDRARQTRKRRDGENAVDRPQTEEDVRQAIMAEVQTLAGRYGFEAEPFQPNAPTRAVGFMWYVVHPFHESSPPTPGGHDDTRAAIWWALYRLSSAWRTMSQTSPGQTQDLFERCFSAYETPLVDIMLLLVDAERTLPDQDRACLDHIERLIRLAHESSDITHQGGDDVPDQQ